MQIEQEEQEEQEIAEACNCVIKNSIIFWNYLYLARHLEKAPATETRENRRRAIAVHMPTAWSHINMGEYDFAKELLKDAPGIHPLKSTD